jgi:hypothetical protein
MWGNNGTLLAQPAVKVNLSSVSPALTTEVEFITVEEHESSETVWKHSTVKISIPSTLLTSTITLQVIT